MIEIKDFQGGIKGIPQLQDRKEMWESSLLIETYTPFPAMNAYIKALQTVYTNGKVEFRAFKIHENELFDWYASRNQFHEMGLFNNLWTTKTFSSKIQLKIYDDFNFYSNDVFSYSSSFTFAGELAEVLNFGGAYDKHQAGALNAKKLADKAANEIIQDLYDESFVFRSFRSWSDFFYDVAWDYTWIVINKKTRQIFCLLTTDTD